MKGRVVPDETMIVDEAQTALLLRRFEALWRAWRAINEIESYARCPENGYEIAARAKTFWWLIESGTPAALAESVSTGGAAEIGLRGICLGRAPALPSRRFY